MRTGSPLPVSIGVLVISRRRVAIPIVGCVGRADVLAASLPSLCRTVAATWDWLVTHADSGIKARQLGHERLKHTSSCAVYFCVRHPKKTSNFGACEGPAELLLVYDQLDDCILRKPSAKSRIFFPCPSDEPPGRATFGARKNAAYWGSPVASIQHFVVANNKRKYYIFDLRKPKLDLLPLKPAMECF